VQQRCRIGAHCFIGGLTGVQSDTVPFAMALGNRAALGGINVRGLKRRGFDRESIHALRAAYRIFFFTPGARAARIAAVVETFPEVPAVKIFVDFLRAAGDRPLVLPREREDEADDDDA
jgi:UDP-N-acetylglucosamine acyltransferase